MKSVAPEGSAPEHDALQAAYRPAPDLTLTADIEQLLASSYALGMDHAVTPIKAADEVPAMDFKEAVAAIKSRVPLTKADWSALEPKLRFRAFTVARLSELDAIEKVRRSVISVLDEGKPFSEFWTEANALQTAGFSPGSPWYWETVFRTNVQTAYNTGRAAEFSRVQPEYLEFVGIEDERQTWICAKRSGVIRPASDPWWQQNWPPLHFNCRSTVRGVFQEEVDIMREQNPGWGITPDSALDPRQARVQPGFGQNPLSTESFWKLTPQMLERAESYGIADELRAFAKELGFEDPILGSRLYSKVPAGAEPGIYTREITDPSGGYVDVGSYHNKKEMPQNIAIGKEYARRGKKVVLLSVDNVSKSADALVDGKPIEFKTVKSPSAIDEALRSGKKQADWVTIDIGFEGNRGELKRAIKDRVNRSANLRGVSLLIGGRLVELSRDMILLDDFGGL